MSTHRTVPCALLQNRPLCTSTACYGSCDVTINDSAWYVVSNNTSCSGNTATTNLTIGKKFLGITVGKTAYTITLSCDKNGNLS